MYKNVITLLNYMGLGVETDERQYILRVEAVCIEIKIMKSQNIPQLVEIGSHDLGFSGLDWLEETEVNVEVIKDLGFNPVNIVSAIPECINEQDLKGREIVIAPEYERVTRRYLDSKVSIIILYRLSVRQESPPDGRGIGACSRRFEQTALLTI